MKSLQSLSYKTLFTILFLALAGIVFFLKIGGKTTKVSAAWWDDLWHYRKAISLGNSGTATTNQYIKITLDTASLITANKMQPDCDDIRVTNINGNLLTHFIDGNSSYACNTSTTSIYVLADSIPSSGSTIYLYYGNLSATNVEPQLGTQQNPAISCKNILQHRSDNKGTQQYYITPTGNLANSIQVTCDMTYSSGGWTQVWHGLPSEAFANDSTHETINLSNNIIFNEMRVEGTNLNFNVVDTVTQTAVLGSSIRTYFNQVHNASDASNPKVAFHNLSGTQSINLTNNYIMYGYGNSWRVFYTCINVSSIDYLYLGGYTPTCTPKNSFNSSELGCTSSGNYCNNARTTTPKDSGLGLSLYQYQESSVYVRETAITLNINQSMGTIAAEETGGGPIAYWKFDEGSGTTAYDSAGNNNGALGSGSSSPTWTPEDQCISGKCLYFNGSSYVNTNFGLGRNINTQPLTISMWVKPTVSGNYMFLSPNQGTNQRFYFATYNGKWDMGIQGTAWGSGSIPVELNRWVHIEAVINGSTAYMYVNGKITRQISYTSFTLPENIAIGQHGSSTAYRFYGYIDDVKIYPYTRTADQIKQDYNSRGSMSGSSVNLGIKSNTSPSLKSSLIAHYKFDEGNGTTVHDSSGNNLNGTFSVGSSSPTWITGKINKALSFDGIDDNLSTPNTSYPNSWSSPFSISTWIYIPSSATWNTSRYSNIISRGDYTGSHGLITHIIDNRIGMWTRGIDSLGNTVYASTYGDINRDKWYYLTGVWTGTNSQLYINGNFISQSNSVGFSGAPTSTVWAIGSQKSFSGSAGTPFNGLIDEVKIYNTALTPEEIKQDYNQGSAIQFGQTTQNIGGTTTSLDYCIPGDTSYCTPPVAEWNFEENTGTTIKDTSGNNFDGVFNTGTYAPNWTIGKNNQGAGINFNGESNSSYIGTSFPSTLPTNYTAEAWINPKITNCASSYGCTIMAASGPSASQYPIWLTLKNGEIRLAAFSDSSIVFHQTSGANIQANKWYHIAASAAKSGTATIYVNGIGLTSFTSGNNSWVSTDKLTFGDLRPDRNISFSGKMDDIKFYDYIRTPAQIAYDYNRGAPVGWWKFDECQGSVINDSSGNNNSGNISIGLSGSQTTLGTCQTGTSAAWTNGATGKINSSLNFDGVDDYISIPNVSQLKFGLNNFSISTWIKGPPSQANFRYIIIKTGSSRYSIETFGNNWFWRLDDDQAHVAQTTVTKTILDNNWHMLTLVVDRTNQKAYSYTDGVLSTTPNNISSLIGDISPPNNLFLGGTSYFSGQIDDVRIYNYALTAEQIKTVYNNGAVNFQ